jgi:hypothetical protein
MFNSYLRLLGRDFADIESSLKRCIKRLIVESTNGSSLINVDIEYTALILHFMHLYSTRSVMEKLFLSARVGKPKML